ncbi:MAG: hypothetical protein OEW39_08745 [Deltaproteobacteria bacterium]|nr:hypothetical protein [Deltaproteobacteria bacterium]
MGDFMLGCLLGQYNGAQSFDVASSALTTAVSSWTKYHAQSSIYLQTAVVHSSGQGIRCEVYSTGTAQTVLTYDYAAANDLYGRWFTEVVTHAIHYKGWVRADANSGTAIIIGEAGSANLNLFPVPQSTTLQPFARLSHVYSSGPYKEFTVHINAALSNSMAVYVDDVLTTIDPITLYPEWSLTEQARLIQARHRTLGGKEHVYTWGKYFAYEVPLRFLSDSHAALINWWWENQFHLLFTLDTSDSESSFIVRIANDRQPIGGRVKPYVDLWQGVLQLESVHDARLSF